VFGSPKMMEVSTPTLIGTYFSNHNITPAHNVTNNKKFFFNFFFLSQRTCTKELRKNVKKNYFFLFQVKNHFLLNVLI